MMIELLVSQAADKELMGEHTPLTRGAVIFVIFIAICLSVFAINYFLGSLIDKPSSVLSNNRNDPLKIIKISHYGSSQIMQKFTQGIMLFSISLEVGLGKVLLDPDSKHSDNVHIFSCSFAIIGLAGAIANLLMYLHTKEEERILNNNTHNNKKNLWKRFKDFFDD